MSQTTAPGNAAAAPARPVPCWACHEAVAPGAPFCAACRAVQPPGAADHFARLGLAPGFALDEKALDQGYFALQRQLHPDRFVGRSPRERAIAQAQAAEVNQAYETLRDPVRRAVYLLRLAGVELEPGDGATISDPALLMEALEMREALAEAHTAADIAGVAARAEAERQGALEAVSRAFAAGRRDPDRIQCARAATLRLKYLDKLADDIRARRASLRAANASVPS